MLINSIIRRYFASFNRFKKWRFMFGLQYINVYIFLIIVVTIYILFNISVYVWFHYFSKPDKEREEELKKQFDAEVEDEFSDDIPF
ncbi:MAG: hypothetical protein MJ007_02295 [Paludibacteraceae bacterium]|nr:hypothetical protein [Paludibacteraceae bacterium]